MSLTSTAATLATAEIEVRELPMPPFAYGALALVFFFLLLAVLWSFRNTAAKHDTLARARHGDSQGSQGSQRGTDHGAHH